MNSRAEYRVLACNTARDSENKIHDDAVARRFGFSGGLVPGVDVYAYMMHAPVAFWGRLWLEHGFAECRFLSPVYDGDEPVVLAEETADGLALHVQSGTRNCATGTASLSRGTTPAGDTGLPPPPPDERPPADETTLAVGRLLGMRPLKLTQDYAAQYLAGIRETDPLYADEGLAHPGLVLRTCNWALTHNVVLGPWMHVGSTVRNLGLAHVGDELNVRARVTANYERKGHRFVELDGLVRADDRAIARVTHVAIYRPRQVSEAADA
jgi:acyl dehydratase